MRKFSFGAALFLLAAPAASQIVTAQDLRRHVEILASDIFEGRKPGTGGEAKTIAYITAEMAKAGLQPGTPNGWYQPVELVERKPYGHRIVWTSGGRTVPFNQRDAIVVGAEPVEALKDAPVWFGGHGLKDQLSGLDLKGALVLILVEGPELPGFPSFAERVKMVRAAGAAAVIGIVGEDAAWSGVIANYGRGQNKLARDGAIAVQGSMPQASAERLIEEAGGNFEVLLSPSFKAARLNLQASLEVSTEVRRYTSNNVLGRLPGTGKSGETVLFLAHWDHLGICRPDAADKICNGAVDNASGIAVLIEAARRLAEGPRPERDILFLATTAEELGLLGATFFAAEPTLPHTSIVAAINLDTIALTPAGEPVAMIGRGRTPIDPLADAAAKELGRRIDSDQEADVMLERQDGWALAKSGVPTVMVQGAVSDMVKLGAFLSSDYHKPGDETGKIMLDGAAEDAELLAVLGRKLADPHLYRPPPR